MTFLHPAFLWGLTALAVPIAVHLFNFRRYRTLYFSNTQFLKDIQDETRRQSQLKKWLLLLLRLLFITATVLAFAQPVRKNSSQLFNSDNACVQLFIDNSFSMENTAEQGNLLHEAKEKAKALMETFDENASFMLLTQDLSAKHATFLSRKEMEKEIDRLTTSPKSRDLKQILQYALGQMKQQSNSNKQLFLLSDFQQSNTTLTQLPNDSTVRICFIPLSAHTQQNLYIDSCWFDSPILTVGQQANLSVRLRNESDEEIEKLPIKLFLNNTQKAIASADLKANGSALIQIPFTLTSSGLQEGYLEITDHPITFDDRCYFSFQVSTQQEVLRIYEKQPNPFLNALFANDSSINYHQLSVNQMDYNLLAQQDLVILDQLEMVTGGFIQSIIQYVEKGGNLLFIPSNQPKNALNNQINQALQISNFTSLDSHRNRLATINTAHTLYQNTFERTDENMQLPAVFKHYRTERSIRENKEVLLSLENQDELLSVQQRGEGSIFLLTVPLDDSFSEWQRHALFVPTLYNMAILKFNALKLYYSIEKNEPIPIQTELLPSQSVPEIRLGTFSFIPEIRDNQSNCEIFIHDQIQEAGNYAVCYQSDTLQFISFNYPRNESKMQFWDEKSLKDYCQNKPNCELFVPRHTSDSMFAHALQHRSETTSLFIWLALIFILLEEILLRLWKI